MPRSSMKRPRPVRSAASSTRGSDWPTHDGPASPSDFTLPSNWLAAPAIRISSFTQYGAVCRLTLDRNNLRERRLRIRLQHRAEVDILDALYMNALEFHRFGQKRFGRIQSHLRADAVIRRRIELGALRTRNHDEVAVSLETGRNRPFDFVLIINVHVHVDHDNLLDVVMRAERSHDDVFRLTLAGLLSLDGKVITVGTATGKTHVPH